MSEDYDRLKQQKDEMVSKQRAEIELPLRQRIAGLEAQLGAVTHREQVTRSQRDDARTALGVAEDDARNLRQQLATLTAEREAVATRANALWDTNAKLIEALRRLLRAADGSNCDGIPADEARELLATITEAQGN